MSGKVMPPKPKKAQSSAKKASSPAAHLIDEELASFIEATNSQPHSYLGMHPCEHLGKECLVVRAYRPDAVSCQVVPLDHPDTEPYPLKQVDQSGLFEGFIADQTKPFAYRIRIETANREVHQFFDPYSFLPTLSEQDLYLFNEGTEHKAYEKLGAHPREVNGVEGISFAVWAPAARRVSVVGDFNHWDGRYHMMRALGASGVWEIFIPGLEMGSHYKYEIRSSKSDTPFLKTDPYATYYELPPHNASIVCSVDQYPWGDAAWLKKRAEGHPHQKPISIYEVHLGSWRRVVEDGHRPLTYRELAHELIPYVKEMGFTHVELLPITEHPFSGSWGYQVTGFFAPTCRFGSPEDFQYLVDQLHQNGIGIIIDWVPGHFPRDTFALAEFDGTHLYEHEDPRQGEHKEWGTLVFNYGRHEVRNFLLASALSWFERYHIDGIRVDAVASMLYLNYNREEGEWVPNAYGGQENIDAIEFFRYANDTIHKYYPGSILIAEESTSFGGVTASTQDHGLGFDFKWNMGWMHDTIHYFNRDPVHRKHHHNNLTFAMLYQYSEKFISAFSHDEVVHGKGSMINKMGSAFKWDRAQTLRALYTYMWTWPGKKTLFMGCEFGQEAEWRYDHSLDWHLLQYGEHEGIRRLVIDLNRFYQKHPTLAHYDHDPKGFEWVNCSDSDNSVLSYLRMGENPEDALLIICNFTPVRRESYTVGAPFEGSWKEVINSNGKMYGGSGEGNLGQVETYPESHDGRPFCLKPFLPPLSAVVFQYTGKQS